MAKNFKLAEVKMIPFLKLADEVMTLQVDWVTHGNYAVHFGDFYFYLERYTAEDILEAFIDAPCPSYRTPFLTREIPQRGLSLFPYLLEVYAVNNKYIKLIYSSLGAFGINVPSYDSQVLLSIEALKSIRKIIEEYAVKRNTVHEDLCVSGTT